MCEKDLQKLYECESPINKVEKLRKQIFQCRLNGTPIVLDMLTCTDAEKHEIRRLLWEVGIIKLVKPDFFDLAENRKISARGVYTHDLVVRNEYAESDFVHAGQHTGITYGAYKSLNLGEDS